MFLRVIYESNSYDMNQLDFKNIWILENNLENSQTYFIWKHTWQWIVYFWNQKKNFNYGKFAGRLIKLCNWDGISRAFMYCTEFCILTLVSPIDYKMYLTILYHFWFISKIFT